MSNKHAAHYRYLSALDELILSEFPDIRVEAERRFRELIRELVEAQAAARGVRL